MKYMGSKNRIAKDILPIILRYRDKNQFYVEPFVGGANMIDKVDGNRIGADVNEYLIAMWHALQSGWTPPDFISEKEYLQARLYKNIDALTAFIGFGCSYSGKWFGGYARNVRKDAPNAEVLNRTTRNYCSESKRNILKQLPNLLDIGFLNCGYNELEVPPYSIIYCDPPYAGTTGYKDKFNHTEFWEWCLQKTNQGCQVYISEYNAPKDFICIWEKEVNSSLTKNTGGKKATEKLFIYSGRAL